MLISIESCYVQFSHLKKPKDVHGFSFFLQRTLDLRPQPKWKHLGCCCDWFGGLLMVRWKPLTLIKWLWSKPSKFGVINGFWFCKVFDILHAFSGLPIPWVGWSPWMKCLACPQDVSPTLGEWPYLPSGMAWDGLWLPWVVMMIPNEDWGIFRKTGANTSVKILLPYTGYTV